MTFPLTVLMKNPETLSEQISILHARLLDAFPMIDRLACALYDEKEDMLKTFINSTSKGEALKGYEFKLSDSYSLSQLVKTRQVRAINDIPVEVSSKAKHARWVEEQGYQSSFTVPLFHGQEFLGFMFFDSEKKAVFTQALQRDLLLYCNLISLSIVNELAAVRTLVESVRVARDLTEVRDFETGTHLERMARYARLIGKIISGKLGLSDEFVECLYLFAPLHDVGKIGIPDEILLKPGPLDDEERKIMKGHVEKGVSIVNRIVGDLLGDSLVNVEILRNIVGGHHEFLDGSGYPKGLKADEIKIESRIITVADIYDALTTRRPYKSQWTQEMALAELVKMQQSGKLDKDCVDAVISHQEEFLKIQQRYVDR
jgi:HD-GYP domain-containing protein (c-di-GMP phosphodiesterase class II)